LFRVRLQRFATKPYPREDEEAYRIRRRLLCADCLQAFEPPDAGPYAIFISARAVIDGREWCLRAHPHRMPVHYSRAEWTTYLRRTKTRRTH